MMNDNIKTWTTALRSGQYQQARNHLGVANADGTVRHCCLGVACELVGIKPRVNQTIGPEQTEFELSYNGATGSLPPVARDWLGTYASDPYLSAPSGLRTRPDEHDPEDMGRQFAAMTCAGLNDDWGLTFEQIADVVDYFGLSGHA